MITLVGYPNSDGAVIGTFDYGQLRDVTSPGAGDGSPWRKDIAQDIYYAIAAVCKEGGQAPNGSQETTSASQFLAAIKQIGKSVTGNFAVSGTGTFGGLLTVASGGVDISGDITLTGRVYANTGVTVASGGASITGNSTISGTLSGLTGLTVASGGVDISGDITLTGRVYANTGVTLYNGLTAHGYTTIFPDHGVPNSLLEFRVDNPYTDRMRLRFGSNINSLQFRNSANDTTTHNFAKTGDLSIIGTLYSDGATLYNTLTVASGGASVTGGLTTDTISPSSWVAQVLTLTITSTALGAINRSSFTLPAGVDKNTHYPIASVISSSGTGASIIAFVNAATLEVVGYNYIALSFTGSIIINVLWVKKG